MWRVTCGSTDIKQIPWSCERGRPEHCGSTAFDLVAESATQSGDQEISFVRNEKMTRCFEFLQLCMCAIDATVVYAMKVLQQLCRMCDTCVMPSGGGVPCLFVTSSSFLTSRGPCTEALLVRLSIFPSGPDGVVRGIQLTYCSPLDSAACPDSFHGAYEDSLLTRSE